MGNVFELFQAAMARQPERTAFDDDAGNSTTFAALLDQAARIAAVLRQSGVAAGDRVAVQAPKTVTTVALYLACLQTGAVYLPLNTAYRARELAYFLDDARPVLFVGGEGAGATLETLGLAGTPPRSATITADGRGSLQELAAQAAPDTAITARGDSDLAVILYTSGTTGRSKGAMLSHENLASNAQALHRCWRFEDGDVLLHALPIFHVHGLFVALHCAFLNASTTIFLPRFDVDAILRRLPDASVFMGVPTFYTRLLAEPRVDAERAGGLRLFIAGSAPLLPDTFAAFRERTGHRILERYGMSEAGMIASNPYAGERRPGTVGQPLPGVELRVAGRGGEVLPAGEVGSVEVRGPNVFRGYWEMPDKTAEDFTADGFFVTGDLGRIDAEGYLQIVGRSKDMVISGGYNVYPSEVEAVLDEVDGIKESAVIGVPHADFGEAVVATVVAEPGATIDEAGMIAGLKPLLAAYKVPKRIVTVEALPRNAMGKVQKKLLREQLAALFQP